VVHHQSEDYNLSTALRQTGSGWLFGWVFYLPMALLGFPPLVFGTVALIDLLYQFWVHTRQIGRLGWFDRWFCSPSNHRVHHAVNDRYLDRNYGGILMVWDRLFGSFVEEDDLEPIVYGTRKPLRSWNPVTANLEVYAALARDSWRARSWADKVRVWFKPPGWRPADVAARYFIAGLVAFLVAHLFYIALFKQGQAWFPSRRSLAATLGAGLAMYVFLFPGLNAVLKGAVAAYVVVIALMAAQAIGRATVLRDKASVLVAVGAVFFMVSDSLLATNKFAVPIPMAQFWVLGTYYMAQILISRNAVPVIAGLTRNPSHAGPPFGARAMDPGSSPG
jgi:hypothetical protein